MSEKGNSDNTVSIRVDKETYARLVRDAEQQHRTLMGQMKAYQEAYHGGREIGT